MTDRQRHILRWINSVMPRLLQGELSPMYVIYTRLINGEETIGIAGLLGFAEDDNFFKTLDELLNCITVKPLEDKPAELTSHTGQGN